MLSGQSGTDESSGRLTSAGQESRRKLAPALAALEQTLAETGDLSDDISGLSRVGFVLATEGLALSQLVAAFHARYPTCEVRLQEVEIFDAYRALRHGDVDVLSNWLDVDEPDLHRRHRVRLLPVGACRSPVASPRRPDRGVG